MQNMRSVFVTTLLVLAAHLLGNAQCFDNASKIDAEHWSYLKEYRSVPSESFGLPASCAPSIMPAGQLFEVHSFDSSKFQLQVLTNGKFGNLKDSAQLIVLECSARGTECVYQSYEQIKKKKGKKSARFVVQVMDADTANTYYVFVGSTHAKKEFTVRTTTRFRPNPWKSVSLGEENDAVEDDASTVSVRGRVLDQTGIAKEGERVSLYDEDMTQVGSALTDAEGLFTFEKLPLERTYMALVEEPEAELQVNMFLYDNQGKVLKHSKALGDYKYEFEDQAIPYEEIEVMRPTDYRVFPGNGKMAVAGKVVDDVTYLIGQKGLRFEILDNHKKEVATVTTDANGYFLLDDLSKGDYTVRALDDMQGYFAEVVVVDDLNIPVKIANSRSLNANGEFKFQKLPREVVELKRIEEMDQRSDGPTNLSKLYTGSAVVLKNIFFETGSAELLPSSFDELGHLMDELEGKPEMRLEISGHTDNTGGLAFNSTLSEKRAKQVYDYLVQEGITPDRLVYKGYGVSAHIASNRTEEGRTRNRRVEIRMIN